MRYQWKLYFDKHKKRKPKQQLLDALSYVKNKNSALDLGCGLMIETKEILKFGFAKVVAIDSSKALNKFIKPNKKIIFHNLNFRNYKFPKNEFDLINAEFSLPFYGKLGFSKFFNDIKNSLKKDGIFSGQLFGVKDSWNNKNSKMVFQTKKEVLKLLKDFDVIYFEEKYDPNGSSSTQKVKAWHVFRFIVRKIN